MQTNKLRKCIFMFMWHKKLFFSFVKNCSWGVNKSTVKIYIFTSTHLFTYFLTLTFNFWGKYLYVANYAFLHFWQQQFAEN